MSCWVSLIFSVSLKSRDPDRPKIADLRRQCVGGLCVRATESNNESFVRRHVGAIVDLTVELIAELQQRFGVPKGGFFKEFQGDRLEFAQPIRMSPFWRMYTR